MESTGLEEPFWYIIISTGGTFTILATTVLVFGKGLLIFIMFIYLLSSLFQIAPDLEDLKSLRLNLYTLTPIGKSGKKILNSGV